MIQFFSALFQSVDIFRLFELRVFAKRLQRHLLLRHSILSKKSTDQRNMTRYIAR